MGRQRYRIIVDLAGVEYISSAGWGAIISKIRDIRSKKGDIILLSPGAASFGVFKNEYDRGEKFVRLVNKL